MLKLKEYEVLIAIGQWKPIMERKTIIATTYLRQENRIIFLNTELMPGEQVVADCPKDATTILTVKEIAK
jgi:hypothetical protein